MRPGYNWLIVAVVGLILIVAVLLVNFLLVPWAIHYQVSQTLALEKDSEAWGRFVETPVSVSLKIWVFEVNNPEEVVKGGKPSVTERGPYVYKETRKKEILSTNDTEDTVTYKQTTYFTFDPAASGNNSLEDEVTIIHPVIVGMMEMVEGMALVEGLESLLDLGLEEVLRDMGSAAFVRVQVGRLLFSGLPVNCNLTAPSPSAATLCSSFHRFMPLKLLWPLPSGDFHFGLLHYKNGTSDESLTVNRGRKRIEDLGNVVRVSGKKELEAWPGSPCQKVRGNDEALLPPFLGSDPSLWIYNSDVCGGTLLKHTGSAEYKGVSGLRLGLSDDFLASVDSAPDNYCYCPGSIKGLTRPNACLLKGLRDLSSCLEAPGILSLPHLYQADPVYQASVDGLKPDPVKHDTYFDLEPTTGVPLRGYQRVQVNLLLKPMQAIRVLRNAPTAVYPLLWMEEGFELPDSQLKLIKDQLLKVLLIVDIVKWVLIVCGVLMVVGGGGMSYYRLRGGKSLRQLLSRSTVPS